MTYQVRDYNIDAWVHTIEMDSKQIQQDRAINFEMVDFSKSGVLPMIVSKMGLPNEMISEAIICDTIAGGARYENDMPKTLSLTRRLKDGTEFRARYVQVMDDGDEAPPEQKE